MTAQRSRTIITMLLLFELIVLSPWGAHAEPVGPRMGIGPSTTLMSENLTFSNFTSSFTAQGTFSPPSINEVFVQPIGPQDFFSIFTFFPPPPGTTFEGGLHISTPPIFPFGSGFFVRSPASSLTAIIGYDVSAPDSSPGFDYIKFHANAGGTQNIFPQLPPLANGSVVMTVSSPEFAGSVSLANQSRILVRDQVALPTRVHFAHVETAIHLSADTVINPFSGLPQETSASAGGPDGAISENFGLLVPEPSSMLLFFTGIIGIAALGPNKPAPSGLRRSTQE